MVERLTARTRMVESIGVCAPNVKASPEGEA
jgi:hypothetical protein